MNNMRCTKLLHIGKMLPAIWELFSSSAYDI